MAEVRSLQSHNRTKSTATCVRRSDDPSTVNNVRCRKDEDGPAFGKTIRDSAPFQDSFFQGISSSSVTSMRDNTGFFVRQTRCPLLHSAQAVSFSVCVEGRFVISASHSSRFFTK